eukprot:CAMPEP_0114266548 /NCGR_PEP_ID=MMETSP0058-20121206/24683_1 /TAXON_ID=36894 /ORGANISM="Pyramimonas parkeae, CCMP726" /LENGTH=230 /DNA_ID=CAMNT_0001384065 /DNA_START=73 /DNA_END=761 /DNA_ORIENTATION=-
MTNSGPRSSTETHTGGLQLHLPDHAEAETVYARDNVHVNPGPKQERIWGRLSLARKRPSRLSPRAFDDAALFLAWLPYAVPAKPALAPASGASGVGAPGSESAGAHEEEQRQLQQAATGWAPLDATGNPKSVRTLYAVHPIALTDVRAIKRNTPTIGYHHIILVLHSGLTLPPLYFHNGGVKAFLNKLKQHALLVRSVEDPNTYLVNDVADPLQRSMTVLDLQQVHDRAA